ncbi:pectinesterase family protein [Clostridium sp. SHJSY1]|uniref:pectinesterase family protein n=1 Tax=Clostridium sp. SHJSY1 TaxID=2942483 RepID=UPI002875A1B7|nr:pectinesterase family protein [Clostridium sp. SHJSY1]MDS0524494.1 pectinesterase family protein [Clostridium sp. SHJSY1]
MITVAKDGSGDFINITDAISSIPSNNKSNIIIYIKNGTYKEKIHIEKPFLSLIGEDVNRTKITYDDYAKKTLPNGEAYRTFNSYTIFIGSHDFTAQNLTFENSAGNGDIFGQAVAVYVEGDKSKFKNCRFLGKQDTLFTGPLPPKPIEGNNFGGPMEGRPRVVGRQYYEECYIEGDIDFIFGSATAVFNGCEIFSKNKNSKINGYITAASTVEGREFGYVFMNCKLTSDAPKETVYLGRPWRDYAKTVFINCYLGEHIRKEGWHSWDKLNAEKEAYYAEYKSYGPGASDLTRVSWCHILNDEEVKKYTLSNIFNDDFYRNFNT